ncbi:hypothetical protein [Halobaculum marinum]|uniref:Uncharacterized protein n=1 Tax=Halobaculum marinum TaxID=3031996 RepID=A0ABD5WUW8_9EURY|nr:hypothetical protein [Halobaculum sp. DT55]
MNRSRTLAVAALVVLSLLAVSPTVAAAQQQEECSIDNAELDVAVAAYNANLDQVPGPVRGQLADERVDVRIDTPDGERRFGAVTDNSGRVSDFSETGVDDPTLRVETSESTICGIVQSDDPAGAALDAYRNDEIRIEGVGAVKSVTFSVAKAAVDVVDFFSGLF